MQREILIKYLEFKFVYAKTIVINIERITTNVGKYLTKASYSQGFPGGSDGKESACSVGDLSSIPGLGRSPGEGKGYPLQYSGLENPMDCIVHVFTKSQTRLSNYAQNTILLPNRKSKGKLSIIFVIQSLSCVQLFATPWTIQSIEFSRPEYWSGQPFSSPGELPNPGIEPRSPTLQEDPLPAEPPEKPREECRGVNQEFGINRYTLLYNRYTLLHSKQ